MIVLKEKGWKRINAEKRERKRKRKERWEQKGALVQGYD